MKTKHICLQGVALEVPEGYDPPTSVLTEFPNCCGAGKGFGEKVIPETIWGLCISAACHIHDYSWEVAAATETDFKQSNSMFLRNIKNIIITKSANGFTRALRNIRAMTYYVAVEEVGIYGFWNLKEDQGLITTAENPMKQIYGSGDSY